jgi:hypothetical protein
MSGDAHDPEPADLTDAGDPAGMPTLEYTVDGREREGTLVRPYGWYPEVAIARQIGGRPLYLGNRHAADPELCDRGFDAVLTVTRDREPATTHFRPLVDGPDADWGSFRDAADTARRLYREQGSLLVHCTAGMSRSNTIIATTIACEEDRPLADAFDLVLEARPYAVANPRLHELAVYYVAAELDVE